MSPADQLAPVTLHDPGGELAATVIPGAGMLITSLQHRGAELLGQRRGLDAYLRDGKTMGIPLLAPWANRVSVDQFTPAGTGVAVDLSGARHGLRRDPHGYAIHGVLAADAGWTWELVSSGERPPSALRATLDLARRPELLAAFPFPHRLDYVVSLAESMLHLELVVTATGDVPVPIAHGLHPYLTLPGVPRADWHLALPARDHLALNAHGLPTGSAVHEPAWRGALGDRTFDDAYDGLADGATWVVEGGGRRLTTCFDVGYPAAQVFAPGDDPVICFEPMAAPTNALITGRALRVAAPGTRDVARLTIAVATVPDC